ncbi:hypothetical protein [Yoonia sp.]|uniref:hypothetical protein n=1 Tax=Yoonia sp. TaxID=2212373 RepID=UPI003F6B6CE2
MRNVSKIIVLVAQLLVTAATAETVSTTNGGDSFMAGSTISQTYDAPGDIFVAGEVVTISGQSDGDVHIAGMNVEVDTNTNADLYAAGATVTVRADVAQDVTAMGYTVRLSPGAAVGGNARLLGRALVVNSPIAGALTAAGGEIALNSVIQGDVRLTTDNMTFGPDAQIMGQLVYASRSEIDIPERVISSDRVRYERLTRGMGWDDMRDTWEEVEMPALPTFISLFSVFLITLAFFVLIGSIFLTFAPKHVSRMRRDITNRPGHIFLLGIVGLSMLFGLIPITALTIVGIPFVPFGILLIILAWTLGYLLAAYAIAMRVMAAAGGPADPSLLIRLVVLAVAVCVVTLLNFIPFVGWIINYTLVLLGVGAMTAALFNRLIGNPGYALDVDMKPTEPE